MGRWCPLGGPIQVPFFCCRTRKTTKGFAFVLQLYWNSGYTPKVECWHLIKFKKWFFLHIHISFNYRKNLRFRQNLTVFRHGCHGFWESNFAQTALRPSPGDCSTVHSPRCLRRLTGLVDFDLTKGGVPGVVSPTCGNYLWGVSINIYNTYIYMYIYICRHSHLYISHTLI